MDANPAPAKEAPTLNEIEARILGCLIEKAATTPEVYPLTLNATVIACNQKTNRDPVMNLEPGAVGYALRQMEGRGLVKTVDSSRAVRYEHRIESAYTVTPPQRALLCVMLLRGPQTLSELFTRTERLTQFPNLDEVRYALERLAERASPLVIQLGRASGQREDRYMHLLCGPVTQDVVSKKSVSDVDSISNEAALEVRVERLEALVGKLRAEVAELRLMLPTPNS